MISADPLRTIPHHPAASRTAVQVAPATTAETSAVKEEAIHATTPTIPGLEVVAIRMADSNPAAATEKIR